MPAVSVPTLQELFPAVEAAATVALFGTIERKAIEKLLAYGKADRPVIRCQVRQKDVPAKPEEIVRQLWIYRLLNHYKYPLSRITVEYPITFGRDSSKRADIVVFDADRVTIPFLIIEVKAGRLKDGKEQLKSYCHATGAPLAVWSNGRDKTFWHRKNPNYFVEIPALPTASQDISDVADQPWTIDTLVQKEKEREASSEARSLKDRILEMEDEVLANAGVDVFEEVFKLVFTKLYDELSCYREEHTHIRFRNTNTASQLKTRIQDLFDEAKTKWEGVFSPDEKIRLTADHLAVCVGSLEEYKLFNSNLDVVDEAFEYLVNKSSKGEKGQYFTPRHVIDLCVRMLNPGETETLIDTACGSAGFTMHAIFHVWERILREEGFNASHLFTLQKKPRRCEKYVQDKVFAIDFDERSVRVARCLNLIAGDGQTNVLHLNTLDYRRWEDLTGDDKDKVPGDRVWRETYGPGWKKLRALRAAKADNRAFNFDVLLANPPFAGDIKQTDMLSPYELAHKVAKDGGQGKLESAVGRDLLFIERNLDFLRPGGRMAVVLPQGRFNNSSDERVRRWIAERCRLLAVVGLHGNTFKPHTGTKTSVLFVQKWNDDPEAGPLCPKVADYPIFFATQRLPSKDNRGDKIWVRGTDGLPVRDSHGHQVVQHDFFSVELKDGTRTPEGIAEAFEEFAKKEKLPFFP
jgi:type I restriction enzyme M protein